MNSDSIFEEWLIDNIYEENIGVTKFILCSLARDRMTNDSYVDLWKGKNQYKWTIEHFFSQGNNVVWGEIIANGDIILVQEYLSTQNRQLNNNGLQ